MLRPFYADRPDEFSSYDTPEVSKGEEVVLQDREAGESQSMPTKTSEPPAGVAGDSANYYDGIYNGGNRNA